MGGAMTVADSSDDDDSPSDSAPKHESIFDRFEIRSQIVPRKRRADDEKPTKAKKRRSETKVSEEAKWKCGMCGLTYTNKGNLARHERKAHFDKDKTKCKCQKCGLFYSNKSNLARHEKIAHPSESPETDEPNLTECRLCNLNYSVLYKHYGEHHSIDYVEDLLFDDGTVLVSTSPDTESGKAPWFLNQKKKATRRLNALKCRLCEFETEFPNKNLLKHHFITDHKVDKDYLENVGRLFRMEKGAHLKSDGKDGKQKSVPTNHTDGKADNDQSLNKCELCGKHYNPLNKHYGKEHGINDVEDLVFDNGNVLIISSVNTENGKAAWFLDQKEIAKRRLNNRKCRLCICETEFSNVELLNHHYTALPSYGGHRVHSDYLWKMEHLFRKDKKAHLKENSDSSRRSKRASEAKAAGDTVNKSKKKVDVSMKSKMTQPENIQELGLITYICNCGVATETYDASVDHAQKHLVCDYAPTTKHCRRCDLAFEDAWFEEHVSRHGNADDIAFKAIKYDYKTLFSDKWFDMFSVLPDSAHAKTIEASSLYKHTRRVKMSWNFRESGVPLYQCGTCTLFVDPAKVENHIGACSSDELQGHYCSECKISFSTADALKKHEVDHTTGLFRLVTFNNKTDVQFNKALMRPSAEESQESNDNEENIRNPKRLKRNEIENILDNGVMKFCNQCKRSVNNFDAHSAAHKTETKKKMDAILRQDNMSKSIGEDPIRQEIGREKQVSSGNNCKMDTNINEKDVQKPSNFEVSKDGTNRTEIDSGDTVIQWETDSDSESIQESFITVKTQAQINERAKDYESIFSIEQVSHVSAKDTPGEENDKDVSEVVNSKVLVIEDTSQADIQAESERVETDNVVNKTQRKDEMTLNNIDQENTCSTEDGVIGENNQNTNEINSSGIAEMYLRQVCGSNANNTEELDANKDAELQSTQELLQTLEGTENKDSLQENKVQNPGICKNDEVTQKLVTRDISHLLPLIRLLTAKFLDTKKQ